MKLTSAQIRILRAVADGKEKDMQPFANSASRSGWCAQDLIFLIQKDLIFFKEKKSFLRGKFFLTDTGRQALEEACTSST